MSEQGKIMVKNLSKKASPVFLDRMFCAYGKIIEITVNIRQAFFLNKIYNFLINYLRVNQILMSMRLHLKLKKWLEKHMKIWMIKPKLVQKFQLFYSMMILL